MDIKELALKIAEEMGGNLYTLMDRCEDFATRLIAAYMEGQEPVARVIDGGGELHLPKLQWVSANHSLETPIGSKLFTAPPEPAPRLPEGCMWAVTKGGHSICQPPKSFCQKGAALSSEEVREMVGRLRRDTGSRIVAESKCHEAADLIERLAARVPDGCVVVPMEPTKEMVAASWHAAGSVRFGDGQEKYIAVAYQAMISAGEVKP